jgi:hypothetical protein
MDNEATGGLPAADWYPDPQGGHELRYWDGTAWTPNVADGGQASVDPLEASPTTPVAAAEVAASGHEPAPRGMKRLMVVGAVLLLFVVVGAGGCSVVRASMAARDAAASSIDAARVALAAADPAVEPGSQELSESQKGKSDLDAADALYTRGSLIDAAPYAKAKAKADEARAIARAISARVEASAAEAAAAGPEDAVDLYFALAVKYPRTPQGQEAVTQAANVLLDNLPGSDLADLDALSEFCDACPGEVPSAVYDAATASIKAMASASANQQASIVSNNKSWVKKIRGKGVNFTISSTTAADTGELNHIIGTLAGVHGTDFGGAVKLLRDCSKLGEACGKIARSPVRKRGSVQYFSRSQVNKISTLSSQMAAKISKARGLLQDL